MGSTTAIGLNESIQDGYIDLDTALLYHLQNNHYPPIHKIFIETAKKAIGLANDFDEKNWDKEIKLPNGIIKTVGDIINELHLEPFLDQREE